MKKLLLIIVIVAALARLLFLGQFPNGFTGDEVQQGYSAYSILQTGKDEWGQFLPLFPRGFGDYKPPLYTYLTVPSVAVFGLTPEAVRLPAALVGILSVVVIFYLTRELISEKVAIWSSFLLAINPWSIQLSRTAFEGGSGVLTFPLGLLFFLKGGRGYLLSAIFWGLTLYAYHSWRVFLVLFIIALIFLNRKVFAKVINKGNLLVIVVSLIFILPLLLNSRSILARSSDVGITSNKQIMGYFENKGTSPLPSVVDKIFENKFLYVKNIFVENYLSYFSPQFFFTGGRSDGSYLNFPGFELVYLVEILFFVFAFRKIKESKNKEIIFLWFFLAPIPASLASGTMSAGRTPNFLPLVSIISAIGMVEFINWLKLKKVSERLISATLCLILGMSFVSFLYFYFIKLPQHPPNNLRVGYDLVFKRILEVENQYQNVVISKAFTEPQIFIGFYGKMNPTEYQSASQDWLRYEKSGKTYIDQMESWNLGKYLFEDLNWPLKDSNRKHSLIVGSATDFPKDEESILDVTNQKGQVIYRLIPVNHEI